MSSEFAGAQPPSFTEESSERPALPTHLPATSKSAPGLMHVESNTLPRGQPFAVTTQPLATPLSDADLRKVSAGMRLLSLFHGGSRPLDGIEHFALEYKVDVDAFDLEISSHHDLADDAFWAPILADLEDGKYDGTGGGAPCSTFSASRSDWDGGPRPLRGEHPQAIFGLPRLLPQEKEAVRLGTLLAHRKFQALQITHAQGKPGWAETPARRDGHPSVFKLPLALTLIHTPGVRVKYCVQCMLQAATTKPTEFLFFHMNLPLPDVCTHQPVWWRQPWNGGWLWAPHPPLRGREWMVLATDWAPWMLKWTEPSGPYISRSGAAYPGPLNQLIAIEWIRGAAASRLRLSQNHSMVKTGRWANTLVRSELLDLKKSQQSNRSIETPRVQMKDQLRPKQEKPVPALYDDKACLCGLVNTWECMDKVPGHKSVGPRVATVIDKYLDANPDLETEIFQAIGHKDADSSVISDKLDPLRHLLAEELSSDLHGTPSIEQVKGESCSTNVRAQLFSAWAVAANDPAKHLCKWLTEGAPAGLAKDFYELDGLYPRVEPSDTEDLDSLSTDYESFANYQGVDEDQDAADILDNYVGLGYLRVFMTLAAVSWYLQNNPILSKIGLVKKEKKGPSGEVIKKCRIILDNKQSRVSLSAKRTHRSTLPRATNAIFGLMTLMSATLAATRRRSRTAWPKFVCY